MPTAFDTPSTYPNYTNRNLDDGVFEQLMAAIKHHIKEEYDDDRLTADAYSQVYLGLTEAVLQNSTQYLLGLLLLDEKRRKLDLENQTAEYNLEELLPQDLKIKIAQEAQIYKEIEKTDKEMDVMDQQILVMQAEISKITAEISLMGKQEDKIDKEIEFLNAKIQTERANTESGIAAADSLIGKQITLLTAQRLGFAGDIYAKIGKLWADYDAVFQSVQELEGGTNLSEPTQTELGNAKAVASSITGLT